MWQEVSRHVVPDTLRLYAADGPGKLSYFGVQYEVTECDVKGGSWENKDAAYAWRTRVEDGPAIYLHDRADMLTIFAAAVPLFDALRKAAMEANSETA